MSELTLTVLQLALLVVLWLFVLGVVGVLRGDLYGTRIAQPRPARPAPRRDRAARVPAAPAPPPAAPPPPVRRGARELVVVDGPLRGTTIALGASPVVIGRAPDSTLVVDDEFASGRHARLSPVPGAGGSGWVVEDLGSTNGTFLGRDAVRDVTPVPLRTPVRVGRTVVELRA